MHRQQSVFDGGFSEALEELDHTAMLSIKVPGMVFVLTVCLRSLRSLLPPLYARYAPGQHPQRFAWQPGLLFVLAALTVNRSAPRSFGTAGNAAGMIRIVWFQMSPDVQAPAPSREYRSPLRTRLLHSLRFSWT